MTQKPYVVDELISAKSIAARVEALAKEISAHFADTDKLVVVGLLRGSFIFIADLVRELDLPVEVDFLEASSYGNAMESSREVRILKDLRGEIAGRDVLVVEDIVDTGYTLKHVLEILETRHPAPHGSLRPAQQAKPPRNRRHRPAGSASTFPTSSLSATASTTASAIATCPISAPCAFTEQSSATAVRRRPRSAAVDRSRRRKHRPARSAPSSTGRA